MILPCARRALIAAPWPAHDWSVCFALTTFSVNDDPSSLTMLHFALISTEAAME